MLEAALQPHVDTVTPIRRPLCLLHFRDHRSQSCSSTHNGKDHGKYSLMAPFDICDGFMENSVILPVWSYINGTFPLDPLGLLSSPYHLFNRQY